MSPELEATIKRLRGEDKGIQFQAPVTSLRAKDKGIETFKYDVSRDAVYDKLSDGTYIAKFENYKGAIGNEERLANQQGFGEKALYGVGKFVGKTGKNFLDATVGTVYGVVNGIVEGDMQAVWDNDFSNTMDDWNKTMNYRLPHYYTEEEKNKGLIGSMGTANFWFNDVGDGLAFVAGALLPELAIGAATGGASLGVSAGKFAFRAGAKALLKEGVEKGIGAAAKKLVQNADDFMNYSKGREGIREMYRGALNSKKAGDIASTAGFMFRTSNFEAGMEARNNYHDAMDTFNRDFQEKNGRPPTLSEIGSFSESAKNAANGVYGANLAILSVSNAAMFGKAFDVKLPKIGEKINNRFNKVIGLGVNTAADGTMSLAKAGKLQKFTGNAYKILSKPAIEGIYEEGLQGVAGKTMQNYLDTKYDPSNNHAHSMWSSLSDAFAEQYGTKEGWKEMGIGIIIGMAGPAMLKPLTGQPVSGFGKDSRKSREGQIAEDITKVNKGIETLRGMDRASSVRNFRNVMESKAENFESTSAENTLANVEFVRSQEHIKGTSDILKDYNTVIDNMELDQTQMEELQQSGLDVDTYKEALKVEFKQDLDNYNFAKKAVEAVGLDKVVDTTRGNRATIQEAMIMNIVLGKDALGAAKNTAEQLDKIIKPASPEGVSPIVTGGIFDHLQFYNSLQDDQKQSAEQLRQKKKELKTLQDKNLLYQQELAGLQTRRKRKLKDSTLETNINNVSEKAVITVGQIAKLEQEVSNLEQALQSSATVSSLDIDGKVTNNVTNIVETLEELDKLEAYQESLRKVGKNNEADSIQYLTEQFKFHSDSHREMMNAHRRMLDTNFFNSKRGTSFIGKLIGQPYKMSDDFRQLIKDNDAVIDASLGLVNIRGYETVEQLIQESLEENEELSDREKYKLESMIRIQLNMGAIQDRVNSITSINTEYASEEDIANDDPLEGDTIRLKQKLDLDKRNLDNLDEINKVIKEITDQLDIVRNEYNQQKIEELEARLEELRTVEPETEGEGLEKIPPIDNSTEIADIEKQIEILKEVKIINSPEIIRLTELLEKDDNDTISTEEYDEMKELESSVDDWMLITGTVVEGIRLSDLIRQKHVLENTPITDIEKVEEVTPDQIFDTVKFNDNTSRVNYSYAQSPDAVTAIKKDGKIIISGISPLDLEKVIETPFDFEITDDGKNNIILTEQEIEKINATGKIAILPTNKDLTTTYSVVIEFNPAMNGAIEGNRLKSPHGTEYSEAMETDEIYQLAEGNAVAFDVDPSDIYNQKLIKEYNDAPKNTPEEIEEALEALRVGMVIKVKSGPNMDKFIAVLKGKNSKGTKNESDYKYEAFRNEIADQVIAQGFLTATGKIVVKSASVSIEKIMLGHPSFNFRLNPDGTVSIKYERVSDADINKIVDIGYIENGKRTSKNSITTSDTTFISKFEEVSKKNKVPYIVVEKNGKRIAYPVKLVPRERQDNKDFITVFNNKNITKTDKVVKLNQMLAARGIDIKVPGNAFTSIGQTNLNKEFLDEKLAQLDNIDYFRPLEDWISKDDNMAEIIKEQILVNIDLSNPFHSPKVKLNFEEAYKGITLPKEIMESLKASKKTQRKGKTTKSVVSSALFNQNKNC